MKCKNQNCNNKLSNSRSKTRKGFTGLCINCYANSPLNSRTKKNHKPSTEPQQILKQLATQNKKETHK